MQLLEHEIEEIIYNSPWLLDENYVIAEIPGSRGQDGRQVHPNNGERKSIDLLLKDTRDKRPVVVELKKGALTRESIGQILEYKSLLLGLEEEERELWIDQFGKNYYCPKLILIGTEIEESIKIAANLAGIDIKLFTVDFSEIGLTTFKSIIDLQKEWNRFRNSGKRAVHEREEWINDLLDRINEFLDKFPEQIKTIKRVPIPRDSKIYTPQGNPFLNIPFYNDDEDCIAGIYEFYDSTLPFDDEFIYLEFIFVNETIKDKALLEQLRQQVINFCTLNDLEYSLIGPNQMPIPKVAREVLEKPDAFNQLLFNFLTKAVELYDECYRVNSISE